MTTIFVDADACPVKAEAERVADRLKLRLVIVSNGGIRPSPHPLVETVVVPEGPDVADQWIADRAGVGDIVITGDIPLAARCIAGGARVVKHNGEVLTAANIGNILAMRNLMADLRAADPFRIGGGKPFAKADRSRFLEALDREARAAMRQSNDAAMRQSNDAAMRQSNDAAMRQSNDAAMRQSPDAATRQSNDAAMRQSNDAAMRQGPDAATRQSLPQP